MLKIYTNNDFYAVIDSEQVITTPDIDNEPLLLASILLPFIPMGLVALMYL